MTCAALRRTTGRIAEPQEACLSRLPIPLLVAALLAPPAAAAPLCRDTRGLFTPCPTTMQAPRHARKPGSAPAPAADKPDRATPQPQATRDPAPRAVRDKPSRFATTKLCHDLKGMFTPCPR